MSSRARVCVCMREREIAIWILERVTAVLSLCFSSIALDFPSLVGSYHLSFSSWGAKMSRGVCAPGALLALLVLKLVVPGGQSCPRSCNCYQASEVHCTFRSLLTIPVGLPAHTRRMNLGYGDDPGVKLQLTISNLIKCFSLIGSTASQGSMTRHWLG